MSVERVRTEVRFAWNYDQRAEGEGYQYSDIGEGAAKMPNTLEHHFANWESDTFGFGYGTGEPHTLRALKGFFDAVGTDDRPNSYEYEKLESRLGAEVAWLMINSLCRADIIEYGTSPRFAWLSESGEALRRFVDTKTVAQLTEICCHPTEDRSYCSPQCCNCGPNGYEKGRVCDNPFFRKRR